MRTSGDSVVHFEKRNVSGAQLKFGPNGEVCFCSIFRLQSVLRIFGLIPRVLGSTDRGPMHIRSRVPRRPRPEHFAKAS
jgi:hypothetical protein